MFPALLTPEVRFAMFDPIQVTLDLRSQYESYVTTTLPIRYDGLMDDLRRELASPDTFVKGPYLEATPPFVHHDQTYSELVEQGFLCQGWDVAPVRHGSSARRSSRRLLRDPEQRSSMRTRSTRSRPNPDGRSV